MRICVRITLKRAEISGRSMHWPRNALKSPINIALARNANKLSAPFLADIVERKRNVVAVDVERGEMEETSASVYPHRLTRSYVLIDRSRSIFIPFLDKSSKIVRSVEVSSLLIVPVLSSHSVHFSHIYTDRKIC